LTTAAGERSWLVGSAMLAYMFFSFHFHTFGSANGRSDRRTDSVCVCVCVGMCGREREMSKKNSSFRFLIASSSSSKQAQGEGQQLQFKFERETTFYVKITNNSPGERHQQQAIEHIMHKSKYKEFVSQKQPRNMLLLCLLH